LTDAALSPQHDGRHQLQGSVELVEALGSEKLVHFTIDASRLHATDTHLSIEEDLEPSAGEIGEQVTAVGVAKVPPAIKSTPTQSPRSTWRSRAPAAVRRRQRICPPDAVTRRLRQKRTAPPPRSAMQGCSRAVGGPIVR
jgi:hypothetical protein